MSIVDCHIHMYPADVINDPRAWGTAKNEPWWTYCVDPPHQPTLQGWATVDRLLRDMDAAGVERCIMLGWYWEHQETCDLQNRWFVDWVNQHPDRLSGFATIQPNAGDAAMDGLKRAIDGGLIGIGEIKPPAQHFSFEDDSWKRIVDYAQERNLPINLHVTDPVAITPDSLAKPTPLAMFAGLVRNFPDATFILAHWGGGIPFHELNPGTKKLFKNVYYDTAASPLLYNASVFEHVVNMIGHDRILFGTDYPLFCFPSIAKEVEFHRNIAHTRSSGLADEPMSAILGGNAKRLFGF